MKAGILILLLTSALILKGLPAAFASASQTVVRSFNRDVSFTVAVVLAGYDDGCVDVREIARNLRTTYQKDILLAADDAAPVAKVTHSLSFGFFFSNGTYSESLDDFVSKHSVRSLTSGLDIGALMEQRRTGQRTRVFFPLSGISVDAVALENWLRENPCNPIPVPGYTIYVLNLSHLDSPEGSGVHWFDPGIRDPDSRRSVNWFRLEWDNDLNLPVYPAYAGWGNSSRLFFLDPSAHQWYLKWAAVWWEGRTKDTVYGHDFTGLGEFVRNRDIHGGQGRVELSRYLAGWIDQLVDGLVRSDGGLPRFYGEALVDVLILNAAEGRGVTNQDLGWTTSKEALSPVMNDIAPFMKWSFNITIRDIDSYPEVKNALLQNSTRVDGRVHVLGIDVWNFLGREAADLFNLEAADLVIPCLVIVVNDTSMMVEGPTGIGEYTGLAGGGKVLVIKELSRFYFPGNGTRRSGLTSVLVHEIGHDLGLNHTFPPYCADFTGDVMGYLSNSVHFTKFTKDGFQRNTFDAIYERLMNNMTQIREEQKSSMVQRLVEEALLLYGNMSYVDALRKLQEAMRIAQPGQIAAFTTTCTVTQVETHVSVTTSAHMVATTVTPAATREAEGPTIPLPLFAVFLTLAAALSVIWVKRANRKPNVAVTEPDATRLITD